MDSFPSTTQFLSLCSAHTLLKLLPGASLQHCTLSLSLPPPFDLPYFNPPYTHTPPLPRRVLSEPRETGVKPPWYLLPKGSMPAGEAAGGGGVRALRSDLLSTLSNWLPHVCRGCLEIHHAVTRNVLHGLMSGHSAPRWRCWLGRLWNFPDPGLT